VCVEGSERPPSARHDITRELFGTNCSDSTDGTYLSVWFELAVNIMEGAQNVMQYCQLMAKRTRRSVVGTVRSIRFHVQEFILLNRFKLRVSDAKSHLLWSHKYTTNERTNGKIFKLTSDALNVLHRCPFAQLIHLSVKCAREKIYTRCTPHNIDT
jgi:hypothetical protein